MDYRIIPTLGPSSEQTEVWSAMLEAGATGFRLNTSHLSVEQLGNWLERLGPFLGSRPEQPELVLDLQGSKWRLGVFEPVELLEGQRVELVQASQAESALTLPVPHPDFFAAADMSSREIVLNDARVRLLREAVVGGVMKARVKQGGPVSPRKGITYADSDYRTERLGEKDQAIIARTSELAYVRYAISYIKDAAEMKRYRELVGSSAYLIAKLERQPALDEAVGIARIASEVWLCRGDLGAELGLRGMAEQAQRFSEGISALPVPALLAGQVLEHMTGNSTPTRSEVSYLYESLLKGYQGFVLSDETAVGLHPVEACQAAAMFRGMSTALT